MPASSPLMLNYTTNVDVDRTIGEIHGILRQHRAKAITDEYGDQGEVVAVHFTFHTEFGDREFRLPANVDGVHSRLKDLAENEPNNSPFARGGRWKLSTHEQAERVAWRVVKDWIEAQLALLESRQAAFEQVMLPFMLGTDRQTGGRVTVYEAFREQQLKALPGATDGMTVDGTSE